MALIDGVRGLWSGYVALRQVAGRKRRRSSRKCRSLQIRLQEERAEAQRTDNLRQLLELRERAQLDTDGRGSHCRAGQPRVPDRHHRQGTSDGLATDMAVISPAGVVGTRHPAEPPRVEGAAADRSQRRRRRADRADARAGRGRRARATACCGCSYVPGTADVKTGDLVVTSGIDGIYPKGFVIGTIDQRRPRRRRVPRDHRQAGGGLRATRRGAGRAHAAASQGVPEGGK